MFATGNTGIQFPRLTAYKDVTMMDRVNAQIDEVTKQFKCDEPHSQGDWYKVWSRVEYATRDIFSIYVQATYNCGGAYPTNDANMSVTFDLRTGNKVEFADLFKNYEKDKEPILKIIFQKQIVRAEQLAAAGKRSNDSIPCEEDPGIFSLDNLKDSDYSYNLSTGGLAVQPEWPHVLEACAERVRVPWQELKNFAAPDGVLARVMP